MTFLNPLLLIAAAGIALPILAHLLNRFQVQQTDWAAMQFLNRSVRVRSRQLRLRDLLLLLMRCLAVLCLVFALARPTTNSANSFGLPGEPRAGVVVALDASFSMAHREAGVSRFERAIERAEQIAEQVRPGDPVTLVLLSGEPRVVLRNTAFDADRFAAVLAEQQPSDGTLDLDSVPKTLAGLAADMDASQKEVYFITDAQARDWGGASNELDNAWNELASETSIFLLPIADQASSAPNNLAVTGLDLVSGSLRKGTVARYRATVRNFGDAPVSDVEVRCRVDGVQIDSKRIPLIEPGGSETVSLFVPFYNAGATRLTAEISDEALTTDNIRRAVAVVSERVSVLCLDGSGGDAGRLVSAALLARSDGSDDEDYLVRTLAWPAFPSGELDQIDVLILADVPEITPEQARQLVRFVRSGKGLVWFAGQQVKVNAWNKLSGDGADRLLPAVLGNVADARDSLGVGKPLDPAMPDHAVTRPLQSLPEDLLSETRFLNRLDVEPDDTSFAVLTLAGSSDPLLLERALGRGNVFLFTTSAQTAWNNMAQTPVLPLLLQQSVTYLAGRAFEQPRVVGDALSLSYVDQPDASDAVFDTPGKRSITVPVREHREQFVALLERSTEAGFYVARVSVQAPGMPIAVNVDTRESAVQGLSDRELAERLSQTAVTLAASEADLASAIQAARTGRSSWRWFMIAALVFLVLEALLADRILRRKQSARSNPASAQSAAPPPSVGVA